LRIYFLGGWFGTAKATAGPSTSLQDDDVKQAAAAATAVVAEARRRGEESGSRFARMPTSENPNVGHPDLWDYL
jgi:hypothetical protein